MDEKQTKSLFHQLQSLCKHVDKQMADLKKELNMPAGQKPENYDRGLRILQKDSQDLKKQSKELGEKLKSVTNFSSYLESVQELVNQQSTDIDKMERYLMRFGYVPPQPNIIVNKVDDGKANVAENKEEEPSVRCSKEATAPPTLEGSPILSEVGLQVLQGKDLPLVTPIRQKSTSALGNLPETPATGITKSLLSSAVIASSVSTSSLPWSNMTVDQWLAGTEENVELTPDVLHLHKLPMKKKLIAIQYETAIDMRESKQPSDDQKNQSPQTPSADPSPDSQVFENKPSVPPIDNAPNVHCNAPPSPNEPQLSEYTMQLLAMNLPKLEYGMQGANSGPMKNIKIVTPEEPGLSSFSSHKSHKIITSKKDSTPKPTLSYQEYQSSCATAPNLDNKTPEEPVLSYQHGNITSHEDNGTPEEPTLSTDNKGPVENLATTLETPHRNHNDPCSPELSEVTRSVLSLSSLSLNPQSYQPRKNLYTTRNMHEQLKNTQSFSTLQSMQSSTYIPLRRNISENSLGSRYISQQSKNFELPREVNQNGKNSGVTMEHFLGTDNISSPQLSDITQKVIGQMKRW